MPARRVMLGTQSAQVCDTPIHKDFWDLVDRGGWEPATLQAIDRFASGAIVIDIGAWIGPTALAAARSAVKVVAYEPDPEALRELRANLALNEVTNVEVRQCALIDRDGELPFGPGTLDQLGLSVSSLVYGRSTLMVRARDGRQEARQPEFQQAGLVKIDVEGAEYRLIRSLRWYLRQRRPTLLLSIHGVRWRNHQFTLGRVHPKANAMLARVANAIERAPLVWSLRTYPFWYIATHGSWHALGRRSRWKLLGQLGEQELLLSTTAYED